MDQDWANLEKLALGLILDKLVERIDHIWFGAVCKNWNSVAKANHKKHEFRSNVLPMLMIPTKKKSRTKRSLYGISSNKVYHFQLPVPYSKRCCGSNHGWLATVNPHYVITLLNPFKNVAPISLPPITRGLSHRYLYECNMHKVILSADPITNPSDYVVVAIYSQRNRIAFIKADQKIWTYIHYDYFCFTDVTFYKGQVYAVGRWNQIVSFDLFYAKDSSVSEQIIPKVLLEESSPKNNYAERAYLVKSLEGDLWLVRRFIGYVYKSEDRSAYSSSGTERFEVYELELDSQSGKLLKMLKLESLGDNVLFLGDSDSISVSASHFSDCLQKDSIYFSDDFNDDEPIPYPSGPFDMGIYNVKNGSFGQHYRYNPSFRRMPPPLWVLPPFKWD